MRDMRAWLFQQAANDKRQTTRQKHAIKLSHSPTKIALRARSLRFTLMQ
jgi:hypothetical protein